MASGPVIFSEIGLADEAVVVVGDAGVPWLLPQAIVATSSAGAYSRFSTVIVLSTSESRRRDRYSLRQNRRVHYERLASGQGIAPGPIGHRRSPRLGAFVMDTMAPAIGAGGLPGSVQA
jgi:hypothetical protein